MSLLIALILGAVIGFFGSRWLAKESNAVMISTLLGVAGGILGMAVAFLFSLGKSTETGLFNIPSILCSAIGALLFVLIFNAVHVVIDEPEKDEPSA